MTAKEYLTKYGHAGAEKVAIAAGTKLSYFLLLTKCARRPSVELAKRLEKASGGEMGWIELLEVKKTA